MKSKINFLAVPLLHFSIFFLAGCSSTAGRLGMDDHNKVVKVEPFKEEPFEEDPFKFDLQVPSKVDFPDNHIMEVHAIKNNIWALQNSLCGGNMHLHHKMVQSFKKDVEEVEYLAERVVKDSLALNPADVMNTIKMDLIKIENKLVKNKSKAKSVRQRNYLKEHRLKLYEEINTLQSLIDRLLDKGEAVGLNDINNDINTLQSLIDGLLDKGEAVGLNK
ncbi:hypothetical protein [Candidatus Cardinium hertigii]|uniref:Lipoprotein n=1 Tax=Candidatus Cardinium hertigii TaxID=247481 RepID=A0A3N2QCK7_9BACT|nr:hypothetical protein [Candidatus Cardinium hertigii]ROT47342.1 hypothetical protein EDM02_02785 [Candidatus Cardinium hertigii]